MAEVEVQVNGRAYRIACEDGEELHLQQLAEHIDTHARKLAKSLAAQVGEAKLLLMAGLMVGDELSDALDRVEELEQGAQRRAEAANSAALQAVLDGAAKRIEDLAGRIRSA